METCHKIIKNTHYDEDVMQLYFQSLKMNIENGIFNITKN